MLPIGYNNESVSSILRIQNTFNSHSLNIPGLFFHIWPDDGSFELKHLAEFLILFTIYTVVLLTGINYYIKILKLQSRKSHTQLPHSLLVVSGLRLAVS